MAFCDAGGTGGGAGLPSVSAQRRRSLRDEGDHPKLDKKLNDRATKAGKSRVIITLKPGGTSRPRSGGRWQVRSPTRLINGQVAELSNAQLRRIADYPGVESIHWDRPIGGHMNRTNVTIGARYVHNQLGYTGAGIGVAVIDSGITSWHADLMSAYSNQLRVAKFVDFVNGQLYSYDDFGHGTHVSGIIAGNGHDSNGAYQGVAPDVEDHQPQGARRRRARRHQRCHRRARLRGREQGRLQHPRHQPVGRRQDHRVLQDRPADAGGQARR